MEDDFTEEEGRELQIVEETHEWLEALLKQVVDADADECYAMVVVTLDSILDCVEEEAKQAEPTAQSAEPDTSDGLAPAPSSTTSTWVPASPSPKPLSSSHPHDDYIIIYRSSDLSEADLSDLKDHLDAAGHVPHVRDGERVDRALIILRCHDVDEKVGKVFIAVPQCIAKRFSKTIIAAREYIGTLLNQTRVCVLLPLLVHCTTLPARREFEKMIGKSLSYHDFLVLVSSPSSPGVLRLAIHVCTTPPLTRPPGPNSLFSLLSSLSSLSSPSSS